MPLLKTVTSRNSHNETNRKEISERIFVLFGHQLLLLALRHCFTLKAH